jgi:hypothetical protein
MDAKEYKSCVDKHYKNRNNNGSANIQKYYNNRKSLKLRWMFRDSLDDYSAPSQVASILWKLFGRSPPVTSKANAILIDARMKERQSLHCDDKNMYHKIASKLPAL